MDPAERFGRLETRMDRVEEGVSNFRAFQVDARKFFDRSDARGEAETKFHNKRDQEIKNSLDEHNRAADLKVNIVIAICAIVALVFGLPSAIFALVEVRREILHNELHIPTLARPATQGEIQNAHNNHQTQDAGIPAAVERSF